MDLSKSDLVIIYLYEMGSFDMDDQPEVYPTLTREAVCIKCGLTKEDLSEVLDTGKRLFIAKRSRVSNRKGNVDCVFLTTEGVQTARSLISRIIEHRVEYLDEDSGRMSRTVGEIKKELSGFDIDIPIFDIIQLARRDGVINLREFMESKSWKDDLMADHAFPEMVVLSNTSCNPFGGIFTTFGEPGIILPVNKRIEVGVHFYGKGNVIRWMKRREGKIQDGYHIDGKKGFESLVSGHSPMMDRYDDYRDLCIFKDEKDYRSYFEILSGYDYSIIFSGGTGHGISLAGHAGTILAAISMHFKDGIDYPFNGIEEQPKSSKLREKGKIPVWDFPDPTEPLSIKDMVQQRHGEDNECSMQEDLLGKFILLSQIFEGHWNSSFKGDDNERISGFKNSFNLKGFSSGGACLSSVFGSPVLVELDDNGRPGMGSVVYPDFARNKNIGLIIDRKGGIDDPRSEFLETFNRFSPLIDLHGLLTMRYFSSLRDTSGRLSRLAANVLLETQTFAEPENIRSRKAVSDLIMMQKGIYSSLGIHNTQLDELNKEILKREIGMNLGPIGVGNSGTYFFCIPDTESMHSLRIAVDRLNKDRAEGENLEIVMHGSSHLYIFNVDPLMIVKK